jgi:hypothetical protein
VFYLFGGTEKYCTIVQCRRAFGVIRSPVRPGMSLFLLKGGILFPYPGTGTPLPFGPQEVGPLLRIVILLYFRPVDGYDFHFSNEVKVSL